MNTLFREYPEKVSGYDPGWPPSILLTPARRPPGSVVPYLVSVCFHVGFMAVFVIAVSLFSPPVTLPSPNYKLRATIIRFPKQIFIPKLSDEKTDSVNNVDLATQLRTKATQLLGQVHAAPNAESAKAILIQPKSPLELVPLPTTPSVPTALMWTRQLPAPPPPTVDLRDIETSRPGVTELQVPKPSPDIALLSVSDVPLTKDEIVVPPGNLLAAASSGDGKGTLSAGSKSGAGANEVTKTEATAKEPQIVGRIEHPANGRFDVVLIQASVDESLPQGALKGKPVYTVYLQVGDTKEWIMHYCASEGAVVQKGAFVQLPDPRPLTAPYPQLTFRPADPISGPGEYMLVHGVIDQNGSVQNLKVLGASSSANLPVLDTVARWRFRPATRAGSPATVEMVLAIPVSKS